ncbi:Serine/threonine protein kinase [Klebsormidium nitens]|uniref:non-specific serine/threonine protein kinase n=1 Tax=Klebsormidium nitens TaxID=105231 RepID=A0A1Y1HNU1_KLENI|nr:Serine/threonine protein kinase [Klebsormidium nitens]|eukprot:GAQ78227.1 Serine/threonine protein kinase [Klebsormidium nitens]
MEETTTGMLQKQFEVLKFLGKGSYGSVHKVKRFSDGNTYAIKESNVKNMAQEEKMDAVNEIRLLASVRHDNVIQYHEAFIDGGKLCIVMEFAEHGDLAKAIKDRAQQRKHFPEEQIWSYLIQICRGLQALHATRIIHRDIKSANIMRPDSSRVKIGDLGVAKVLKGAMTKTQIGTPHYMPPEVWKNKPYSFSSDIWALGCVLFEMCTFNVPFEARSMSELRYKVIRGTYPAIPAEYSKELAHMVKTLLNIDQATRPSAEQVLGMPIVQAHMALAPPLSVPTSDGKPMPNPMLATIQVPQNLRLLKAKLPRPAYPSSAPSTAPPSRPPLPPSAPAPSALSRQPVNVGGRLPAIASGRLYQGPSPGAGRPPAGPAQPALRNSPSRHAAPPQPAASPAGGARRPSDQLGVMPGKDVPGLPAGYNPYAKPGTKNGPYAKSPYAQGATRNPYKRAPSNVSRAPAAAGSAYGAAPAARQPSPRLAGVVGKATGARAQNGGYSRQPSSRGQPQQPGAPQRQQAPAAVPPGRMAGRFY